MPSGPAVPSPAVTSSGWSASSRRRVAWSPSWMALTAATARGSSVSMIVTGIGWLLALWGGVLVLRRRGQKRAGGVAVPVGLRRAVGVCLGLQREQLRVDPVGGDELVVVAVFDDLPGVEDVDVVGVADGVVAVGDEQDGASGVEGSDAGEQVVFGAGSIDAVGSSRMISG